MGDPLTPRVEVKSRNEREEVIVANQEHIKVEGDGDQCEHQDMRTFALAALKYNLKSVYIHPSIGKCRL